MKKCQMEGDSSQISGKIKRTKRTKSCRMAKWNNDDLPGVLVCRCLFAPASSAPCRVWRQTRGSFLVLFVSSGGVCFYVAIALGVTVIVLVVVFVGVSCCCCSHISTTGASTPQPAAAAVVIFFQNAIRSCIRSLRCSQCSHKQTLRLKLGWID